jgi:NitT/TauT family transport system ATP-binding protein/sulfonate transport system ATP-binding protein
MASGPGVSLDIAAKRFPGAALPLLDNLQLTLAPSSTVALVGPSGVGKSTILRLLAGIDRDFAGSITVDGVPAHLAPPPGFVFQDPRLLPWLSAEDNIRAVAPAITLAMAETALAQVGLAEAGALFPHQLSGGMQRRVALARAFSVNAGLLLLDEPFVSLDRALVGEMQQVFNLLVAQTRPMVLLVTHLAEDAALLADRAIVLAGRPARIAADIALSVPPARRDATILADYRAQLEAASR